MVDSPKIPVHRRGSLPWARSIIIVLILACGYAAFVRYGELLTLETLAARESELRALRLTHPVLVYVGAFAVYALVTGLLPSAAALTLLYGWYFGFWRAVVLVSFASTAGATLSFGLSRFLLRDFVQRRFGDRLTRVNAALKREGAFYLFTLRMVPAVPFFILNPVMGLTPMPVWTYWWVSQLGMLPATCVYVSAGASVPELATLAEQGARGILTPQLIAAFAVLALFPWAVRRIVSTARSSALRRGGADRSVRRHEGD